ncbi:MAG: hypothetical protein LBJ74_04935 [Heliobacteriaceae bacterium]|jgi:hypothetical protein|nr:hypothetical protein [Heliobacteriaceae bacterium]
MVLPVNNINSVNFTADKRGEKKSVYAHDRLLKNNFPTRARIAIDKVSSAFTIYPAKGLKGSKNSNFYEFLTLGIVPYVAGSLTLMGVFNAANKHFPPADRRTASMLGKKLAAGVLFYGLFKGLSKTLVTAPVHALTGVDTEVPYAKVNYELPDHINDTDITSIEYHKVFESVDFPRWDLLYSGKPGQAPNAYYDKVAKKLGMGDNLKDSDQEVKPRIREIVTRTNIAKSISSYLWAAVGVALAFQTPWEKYFNIMTLKFKNGAFKNSMRVFGQSFKNSAKTLYTGADSELGKHTGKVLLFLAAASTVLGVLNAVRNPDKPSKDTTVIDKGGKYVTA